MDHRAGGVRHQGILTPEAVAVARRRADDHDLHRGRRAPLGDDRHARAAGRLPADVRLLRGPDEVQQRAGSMVGILAASPTIGISLGDPEQAGVEMDVVEHRVQCVTPPAPTPPQTCGPKSPIADRAQLGLSGTATARGRHRRSSSASPSPDGQRQVAHVGAELDADTAHVPLRRPRDLVRRGPISRRDQYIVLSSEVWEFFAGEIPPPGYGTRATSTTDMQVDYVRAWATPVSAPLSTTRPRRPGTGSRVVGSRAQAGRGRGCRRPRSGWRGCATGPRSGRIGPVHRGARRPRPSAVMRRAPRRTSAARFAPRATRSQSRPHGPPPARRRCRCRRRCAATAAPSTGARRAPSRGGPIAAARDDRGASGFPVATSGAAPRDQHHPGYRGSAEPAPRPTGHGGPVGPGRRGATTVRLKLSQRARAAIRRALRSRRRVSVRWSVRVIDSAGNGER